jgi:CRP/FNR family cyclic AMP-dependent transcriptional regulator
MTGCAILTKMERTAGIMKHKAHKNSPLGGEYYLGAAGKLVTFPKTQTIFTQGDSGDSVFYLKDGIIKLSLTNETGKEAVVALLAAGDFVGEGCISSGAPVRMATATAMAPTTALEIKKDEMIRVLREQKEFADRFISYMLKRTVRIEADLVDQLFNSTEKRLARALLLLARYGKEGKPETIVGKISQENTGRTGGDDAQSRQCFHEQIQGTWFHPL